MSTPATVAAGIYPLLADGTTIQTRAAAAADHASCAESRHATASDTGVCRHGTSRRPERAGARPARISVPSGRITMTVTEEPPLSPSDLRTLDAWWRAANYLSVGQIYLMSNPLLAEPLRPEHVKPRLLGHWGTGNPGRRLATPASRSPRPARSRERWRLGNGRCSAPRE